jgi:8-amino-7-oxononanoate synthase
MNKYQTYRNFCEQRTTLHQLRHMNETVIGMDGHAERNGQRLMNFASNDYLGLSHHTELITRAQTYASRYGAGSTASRLITGNHPAYTSIEKRLAHEKGTESALIINSGYQANLTILAALADKDVTGKSVTVLADRLCHHSLLQGPQLSGARLIRFQHNNYDHLSDLLNQEYKKNTHLIIVSESVFGMDGDCADLATLTSLALQHDAILYIDEAHATGVFGINGFGLTPAYRGAIDVVMGTFGKALGSFGAYIACSEIIRTYLTQRCGGLVYSTALPPAILGSMDAALDLLPQMQTQRKHLLTQASRVRESLKRQGWNCGNSTTQIIPIILGDETAATTLAAHLMDDRILVAAIRPPTVPRETSRLRLSLSAAHNTAMIDHLISVMKKHAPYFATTQKSLAS